MKSITFILLKAVTFYLVALQIQVFDSISYKSFIKRDFLQFLNMAETKGTALNHRFNNQKVEQIKLHLAEQDKMDKMLLNLKGVLTQWQSDMNPDLDEKIKVAFTQENVQKQPGVFLRKNTEMSEIDQKLDNLSEDGKRPNSFKMNKKASFKSSGQKILSSEEEEIVSFQKNEQETLELMKKKLGFLARFLIYLRKEYTD